LRIRLDQLTVSSDASGRRHGPQKDETGFDQILESNQWMLAWVSFGRLQGCNDAVFLGG